MYCQAPQIAPQKWNVNSGQSVLSVGSLLSWLAVKHFVFIKGGSLIYIFTVKPVQIQLWFEVDLYTSSGSNLTTFGLSSQWG